MKKRFIIIIFILISLILSGGVIPRDGISVGDSDELIRLHVLANSDSEADQALKYKVKDAIVKEMAVKFSSSKSINESRNILLTSLPQVEDIARATLRESGSGYDVKTQYGRFFFPTKYYGSFSLPAGQYEAVRVIIGEGKGANWWCVLFPPLCFVPTEETGDSSEAKNSYALNTPERFKKENVRVSFKIVEVIKTSFTTLARIFK
jgi:stage II sporulation protein R